MDAQIKTVKPEPTPTQPSGDKIPVNMYDKVGGRRRIPTFREVYRPLLTEKSKQNDDVKLPSYRPSRLVWAGDQRKGADLTIENVKTHVDAACDLEFFLAADIPLPPEIPDAL